MELHNIYLNANTIIYEHMLHNVPDDKLFIELQCLVDKYNDLILQDKLSVAEAEVLRSLLCFHYKRTITSSEKYTLKVNEIFILKIYNILNLSDQYFNVNKELYQDIIILQVVLFLKPNIPEIISKVCFNYDYFNQTVILCALLKSYRLFSDLKLNDLNQETNLRELIISSLITIINNFQEVNFLNISKLIWFCIEIFGKDYILFGIWSALVENINNQEVFNLLCFLTGKCVSEYNNEIIFDDSLQILLYNYKLWIYYLEHFNDLIPTKKKQINFMISNTLKVEAIHNDTITMDGIVPFICNLSTKHNSTITHIKKIFLLTLDALEETQKQFAMQAIPYMNEIINYNDKHRYCCIGIPWIQAIFKRILNHDNRTVVFEGLILVLKLNSAFYSYEFLKIICKSLNDVRLYKFNRIAHETKRTIQYNLLLWMKKIYFELDFHNVLDDLLIVIKDQTWNLVAIYHVFNAMSLIDSAVNTWSDSSINVIKEIIIKNQGHPMKLIHRYLNRNILKCIMTFVNNKDLIILSELLKLLLENENREDIWDNVCDWLKSDKSMQKKANDFVDYIVFQNSTAEVVSLELILSLLCRSQIILCTITCPAFIKLNKYFSDLESLHSRPYVSVNSVMRMIELMVLIFKRRYNRNCLEYNLLVNNLNRYWKDIMDYIMCKLTNCTQMEYKHLLILINAIETSVHYKCHVDLIKYIESIIEASVKFMTTEFHKMTHYTYPFNIGVLETSIKARNYFYKLNKWEIKYNKSLMDLILKMYTMKPINVPIDSMKDIVISDFYANMLKLMISNIEGGYDENILREVPLILQSATKKNTLLALNLILKCCKYIKADSELIKNGQLFKICWKVTKDCKKSGYYCPAADKTINIMGKLCSKLTSEDQLNSINEIINEILIEGERVPNLMISLMKYWDLFTSQDINEKILTKCILHGDVLRQDQIIEIEICDAILEEKDIEIWSEEEDIIHRFEIMCNYLNYNLDAMVRFLTIIQIMKNWNKKNTILPILMQELKSYDKKRYFKDSYIHKLSMRILQFLLITIDLWTEENEARSVFSTLKTTFLDSNHQYSVRILIEWIFTLACLKWKHFRNEELWDIMRLTGDSRPNSMHSIFRIINNVSRSLFHNEQDNFNKIALKHISKYCMDQKFATRLYSQFVIKNIFEQMIQNNVFMEEYNCLRDIINSNFSTANLTASGVTITEDFYLCKFHPIDHLNVECVYFDIPRLTLFNMTESVNRLIIQSFGYVFKNSSKNLQCLDDPVDKNKEEEYDTTLAIINELTLNSTDVQKKVMPWKSFEWDNCRQSNLNKKKSDLIIVATLVERIPNLGGIARTSEIFGVKHLVISNMKHTENKEFLNLSVSAEKWLDISEIKPHQLMDYIIQKKSENYVLVGAEQTTNSVSLKEMKWSKKTVLVLGNEKHGIPADIIPVLDQCVEIPQIGITRSLNVHVSAALCIWEYNSQMIF